MIEAQTQRLQGFETALTKVTKAHAHRLDRKQGEYAAKELEM